MKCIYLRTNLVNGKQYVGQTNDFKQRECDWKCTKSSYAGAYIDNARKKYGLENWKVEILKECDTQEELNEWEIYYIKKYNTKKPNGYNLTDGGNSTTGYKHTEETIERIRHYGMYESSYRKQVLQYDLDGNFIREWMSVSECCRNGYQGVISACCRGERRRYKGFQWKYKISDEIPQKIEPYDYELTHKNRSESQKGKKLSLEQKMKTSKPVLQYDLDGNFIKEWYAANAAAKELGVGQANIHANMNGKRPKQVSGFMFRYKAGNEIPIKITPYKDLLKSTKLSEETKKKISEAHKGKHHSEETKRKLSKIVYQYTLDGQLVKVWKSVKECEISGFVKELVGKCCNSKLQKYKGYKWSYKPL